jgi:hypothetical protein
VAFPVAARRGLHVSGPIRPAQKTGQGSVEGAGATKAGASSRTPQEDAAGAFGVRRLAAALQFAAWIHGACPRHSGRSPATACGTQKARMLLRPYGCLPELVVTEMPG